MIPALDEHGLLPPGIHDCSVDDLRHAFGTSHRRMDLIGQLDRFIITDYMRMKPGCPLIIDGSFVRKKEIPRDIDVAFDMEAYDLVESLALAIQVRQNHTHFEQAFNIDLHVRHPGFTHDIGIYFQYLGEKGAAECRLHARHHKGILRIRP